MEALGLLCWILFLPIFFMLLILNNHIPGLQEFLLGQTVNNKKAKINEYIINCTNAVIEMPALDLTQKLYKATQAFRFVFKEKHYTMPIDIIIDLAIIEYFELDLSNFIELKMIQEAQEVEEVEEAEITIKKRGRKAKITENQ